jgi:F0F1-type ATP synthase assembly protein I
MEQMLRSISKKVLILLPLLSAAAWIIWSNNWRIAFSLFIGGILSFISLRVIAWAVRRFFGTSMAQSIIIGISAIKILIMFVLMVVLATFGMLHITSMITGFTIVLALIIMEGYRAAKGDLL